MKTVSFETLDPRYVRNILIVRQHDQLGDMICTIPILSALKEHYPFAKITLVTSPINFEVMRNHPNVDFLIKYDKILFWRSPFSLIEFYRMLRSNKYEIAICPSTVSISNTSNIITLISRALRRIGPASLNGIPNKTSFCFTDPIDLDWRNSPNTHQVIRNFAVLQPLGIKPKMLNAVLGISKEEREQANQIIGPLREKYKYLVGLHPGAGKIENRWNVKYFAELINRLFIEKNVGIVISEGPKDGEIIAELKQYLKCPYVIVCELRRLIAVIDNLDIFISNDTGIMHVAGATNTNLIALFGPTDPSQWAPLSKKTQVIKSKDGNMNSISVDEVYSAVNAIILNRI